MNGHKMEKINTTIMGGGIVGCAIAYRLSQKYNDITLFEKSPLLTVKPGAIMGDNQTSRNAGVIHAGIYYEKQKSPLKSRLCVKGNRMMYDFCKEFGVPHKKVGKLLVATDGYGEMMLEKQHQIAKENGVPEMDILDEEKVKQLEPNVRCTKALYSGTTGIVDPVKMAHKMAYLSQQAGVAIVEGNEIIDITPSGKDYIVVSRDNHHNLFRFETDIIINAAGLYSDKVARMVNPEYPHRISPLKLEFASFYRTKRQDINLGMNIYPAPNYFIKETGEIIRPTEEQIKAELGKTIATTVGSHLTPTLDENWELGAEVTISPVQSGKCSIDDYTNTQPLRKFHERVSRFFPNLKLDDLVNNGDPETDLGNRAGILAGIDDGTDFVIESDEKYPTMINLIGIESPGMTSCLAIAEYVKEIFSQIR